MNERENQTWHVMPKDQGQIVTVAWCPLGEDGCLRRVTDASDPQADPSYTLHKWLIRGDFEPWNGNVGCHKRGERITVRKAERLLAGRGRIE